MTDDELDLAIGSMIANMSRTADSLESINDTLGEVAAAINRVATLLEEAKQ